MSRQNKRGKDKKKRDFIEYGGSYTVEEDVSEDDGGSNIFSWLSRPFTNLFTTPSTNKSDNGGCDNGEGFSGDETDETSSRGLIFECFLRAILRFFFDF